MKKNLLILSIALLMATGMANAQTPDAIYIGTWMAMSELGSEITPNENDPKLVYNSSTGCYEGEYLNWARTNGTAAWNAKIPYSVENDIVTYYSSSASTNINFSSNDVQNFEFTSGTDSKNFKGYVISSLYTESLVDVKISMNLSTKEITFTKFESGQKVEVPTLVSVNPENGGMIKPAADGSATITFTFSGAVTSMEVLSNGSEIEATPSNDNTVWSVYLSAERISGSTSDSQGLFNMKLQNVYADGQLVTFEGGSSVLNLSYSVEGITKTAVINITGTEDALDSLNVYKLPYTEEGDELDLESYSISLTYTNSVAYLFSAGEGYQVSVASTVDSNQGANWSVTTDEMGTTLTIKKDASGATFTVTVSKASGISQSFMEESGVSVYSINGQKVLNSDNKESLKTLSPGIYIINGKKVLVK